MANDSAPIRPYRVIVQDSGDPGYTNTLLVGTACTGLLRVEWVAARYGQLMPLNWSIANHMQMVTGGVLILSHPFLETLDVADCIATLRTFARQASGG